MLVKVLSEVYSEWVGIGYCVRIPTRTMEALERRWTSKWSMFDYSEIPPIAKTTF